MAAKICDPSKLEVNMLSMILIIIMPNADRAYQKLPTKAQHRHCNEPTLECSKENLLKL